MSVVEMVRNVRSDVSEAEAGGSGGLRGSNLEEDAAGADGAGGGGGASDLSGGGNLEEDATGAGGAASWRNAAFLETGRGNTGIGGSTGSGMVTEGLDSELNNGTGGFSARKTGLGAAIRTSESAARVAFPDRTPPIFEDCLIGAGVISNAEANFGAEDLEVGFVEGLEKPSARPIRRARFFGVSVSDSFAIEV